MNKKYLLTSIALIGFSAISIMVLILLKNGDIKTNNSETSIENQVVDYNSNDSQISTTSNTAYVDYDLNKFQSDTGRRLLFFYAGWSPESVALDKDILNNQTPENVRIYKVDYETATDLKNTYQIEFETTIIEVDATGNLLKTVNAYDSPSYVTLIREFNL